MRVANTARTTLVTGASRGLGAAIAIEQGAVGNNVAVNYFNSAEGAERVCARIREAGGYAHAFKADVRDEAEIDRMVGEIKAVQAEIDALEED